MRRMLLALAGTVCAACGSPSSPSSNSAARGLGPATLLVSEVSQDLIAGISDAHLIGSDGFGGSRLIFSPGNVAREFRLVGDVWSERSSPVRTRANRVFSNSRSPAVVVERSGAELLVYRAEASGWSTPVRIPTSTTSGSTWWDAILRDDGRFLMLLTLNLSSYDALEMGPAGDLTTSPMFRVPAGNPVPSAGPLVYVQGIVETGEGFLATLHIRHEPCSRCGDTHAAVAVFSRDGRNWEPPETFWSNLPFPGWNALFSDQRMDYFWTPAAPGGHAIAISSNGLLVRQARWTLLPPVVGEIDGVVEESSARATIFSAAYTPGVCKRMVTSLDLLGLTLQEKPPYQMSLGSSRSYCNFSPGVRVAGGETVFLKTQPAASDTQTGLHEMSLVGYTPGGGFREIALVADQVDPPGPESRGLEGAIAGDGKGGAVVIVFNQATRQLVARLYRPTP